MSDDDGGDGLFLNVGMMLNLVRRGSNVRESFCGLHLSTGGGTISSHLHS